MARQGLFFLPLILLLPMTFGLLGVQICQPIADVLTFVIAIPLVLPTLRFLRRGEAAVAEKS